MFYVLGGYCQEAPSEPAVAAVPAVSPSQASLLSTLVPSPTPPASDAAAAVDAQAVAEAAEDDSNVEEQISHLLSAGAGAVDDDIPAADNSKMSDLPAKTSLEQLAVKDDALEDNMDTLEAAKVKDSALDDKLSIELRSIVQQIQVTKNIAKPATSTKMLQGNATRSCCCLARRWGW